MKQANVYVGNILAGILTEDDMGYEFKYDTDYLNSEDVKAISLTMPLTEKPYRDRVLFPFFDGLIPEGWLLDVALRNADISYLDRMSLLLLCCKDCIGAVSVVPVNNENYE